MTDVAGESVGNTVAAIRDTSPAATPQPEADDMPLPTEPQTIFLAGLFLLALLAALYVASPIVLPMVLAIVLKLLLQPLVRLSDRLGVPHGLSAVLAILLLALSLAALASGVAGPAASWAGKLPEAIPQIQQELAFLARPIGTLQWMIGQLEGIAGGGVGPPQGPEVHSFNLVGALFSGTTTVAAGLFTTLVVLFYLLVSGETFLRRFVEILPSFGQKRQAVEITLDIERHISAYLITVTLINVVVGVLTLLVMWACGVANPLLWGLIAFVVNFVPILGPMVAMAIFLMAGVVSLGVTWWALLPVGLYFLIHVVEGEIVTPMLMARRFTINPVAVILALLFWYWMWGVPGAILAVPMLAITKIVCDDIRPLRAFGHFLEA
ncbi:MAG TPA: AI-2E family transporter [Acetobacteraceae bacterium]|nr:AI-2E family transporter [Acetobacteraceae bacterium]